MIELTEKLIQVSEVFRYLATRNTHGPAITLARTTPHNWCRVGVRGVKLEHFYVGSKVYTSIEALSRFFERTSAPDSSACKPTGRGMTPEEARKFVNRSA